MHSSVAGLCNDSGAYRLIMSDLEQTDAGSSLLYKLKNNIELTDTDYQLYYQHYSNLINKSHDQITGFFSEKGLLHPQQYERCIAMRSILDDGKLGSNSTELITANRAKSSANHTLNEAAIGSVLSNKDEVQINERLLNGKTRDYIHENSGYFASGKGANLENDIHVSIDTDQANLILNPKPENADVMFARLSNQKIGQTDLIEFDSLSQINGTQIKSKQTILVQRISSDRGIIYNGKDSTVHFFNYEDPGQFNLIIKTITQKNIEADMALLITTVKNAVSTQDGVAREAEISLAIDRFEKSNGKLATEVTAALNAENIDLKLSDLEIENFVTTSARNNSAYKLETLKEQLMSITPDLPDFVQFSYIKNENGQAVMRIFDPNSHSDFLIYYSDDEINILDVTRNNNPDYHLSDVVRNGYLKYLEQPEVKALRPRRIILSSIENDELRAYITENLNNRDTFIDGFLSTTLGKSVTHILDDFSLRIAGIGVVNEYHPELTVYAVPFEAEPGALGLVEIDTIETPISRYFPK
jgi:hypothetical protein